MKTLARFSLVVLVAIALAGTALATERVRTTEDQDWEKHPEPALQVFKTTGRGIHALVHHSLASLREGNERFPILGSVKIFEGIGTGLVELGTSTYKGMAGSKPKPHDELSKLNIELNRDPVLRNTRQVAGTAAVAAGGGVPMVAGLYAGQKAVDKFPAEEPEPTLPRRPPERRRMTVPEAQRRYVGERAEYGLRVERGRGNLLKQFRYRD